MSDFRTALTRHLFRYYERKISRRRETIFHKVGDALEFASVYLFVCFVTGVRALTGPLWRRFPVLGGELPRSDARLVFTFILLSGVAFVIYVYFYFVMGVR